MDDLEPLLQIKEPLQIRFDKTAVSAVGVDRQGGFELEFTGRVITAELAGSPELNGVYAETNCRLDGARVWYKDWDEKTGQNSGKIYAHWVHQTVSTTTTSWYLFGGSKFHYVCRGCIGSTAETPPTKGWVRFNGKDPVPQFILFDKTAVSAATVTMTRESLDQRLGMCLSPHNVGTVVTGVEPGSPADGKVVVGDVVVAINGVVIQAMDQDSIVAVVGRMAGNLHLELQVAAVHETVVCDGNICGDGSTDDKPIVGSRYRRMGQVSQNSDGTVGYDLCEADFNKLPDAGKRTFEIIHRPGAIPVPCHQLYVQPSHRTMSHQQASAQPGKVHTIVTSGEAVIDTPSYTQTRASSSSFAPPLTSVPGDLEGEAPGLVSSTTTVKVQSGNDLRRITLPGKPGFAAVRDAIFRLFVNNRANTGAGADLFWMDNDGDAICVKSDADLAEAIHSANGRPPKFHLGRHPAGYPPRFRPVTATASTASTASTAGEAAATTKTKTVATLSTFFQRGFEAIDAGSDPLTTGAGAGDDDYLAIVDDAPVGAEQAAAYKDTSMFQAPDAPVGWEKTWDEENGGGMVSYTNSSTGETVLSYGEAREKAAKAAEAAAALAAEHAQELQVMKACHKAQMADATREHKERARQAASAELVRRRNAKRVHAAQERARIDAERLAAERAQALEVKKVQMAELAAEKDRAEHEAEHARAAEADLAQLLHVQTEIPASTLALHEQIGVGSFKRVYRATLSTNTTEPQIVAAMRVKASEVAAEAKVLMRLGKNPRLVQYLGRCQDFLFTDAPKDDTILVAEYAARGSLDNVVAEMNERSHTIPVTTKLVILQQVAFGMEALADQRLIHRDLALRNVLVFALDEEGDVTATTSVKIADFGLTVNASTAGVKHVEGGTIPTRWLAPESLEQHIYSERTDVWAWGVLAWELLSDGTFPYVEITSDDDVSRHVCGGNQLTRPVSTRVRRIEPFPNALWDIVTSCWVMVPEIRPSFERLGIQLCAGMTKAAEERAVEAERQVAELEAKRKVAELEAEIAAECVMCMEEPRSHIIRPCRHACVCAICCNVLLAIPAAERKCPLCSVNIDTIERFFN